MGKIYCVQRGSNEIDNGIDRLDESKVQLLFSKFPVGSGTFKRNKFVYVQYIGPRCSVVKRGQGINEIKAFTESHLSGVPGITSTDKESLSFESLVRQMKYIFVADYGSFSLEQIREEYRSRLIEQQQKMHQEAITLEQLRHRNRLSQSISNDSKTTLNRKDRNGTRNEKSQLPGSTEATLDEEIVANGTDYEYTKSNKANNYASNSKNKSNAPEEGTKQDVVHTLTEDLTPEQVSEDTFRVLEALRKDNGPVNWAVFAADSHALRIVGYGKKGIYELVQNLPEDEWLFGLFRISFFTGNDRQRKIIFFQWIGNKFRTLRSGNSSGIYPHMANALSPFAYEIYLVGQNDLKPAAIINKAKHAFDTPVRKEAQKNTVQEVLAKIPEYTEDGYRTSLLEEMNETKNVDFVVFQERQQHKSRVASDQSILSQEASEEFTSAFNFDVEETLKLVQLEEGGLVWAIFEVR